MNKRVIIVLILMLLLSYNSISAYEHMAGTEDIEDLLNKRIEFMNLFLYGEKDLEILEKNLFKIEADELLENDIDILKKVIDNPTDYELAMNVKIDKVISIEKTKEGILINADLNWTMRGYDGEFSLVRNYDIKCIGSGDEFYLSSLKIVD